RTVVLQGLASAAGVHGNRSQQRAELAGRASIELAIGAPRQPRDLLEGPLGLRLASLLENEHRHAKQRELTGPRAELVDILLHAVANIDADIDLRLRGFPAGGGKDFADRREPPLAGHTRH